MKQTTLMLLFAIFIYSANAQKRNNLYETNPKNDLSLYLKKNVSSKLLKDVSYKYAGAPIIRASFCVDKNDEIYNFETTNNAKKLDYALQRAFENYPLQKLIGSKPNQQYK